MKHLLAFVSALFVLAPLSASAHEHQVFQIGDQKYDFTIGSLNEPVVEDDKAGVELAVWTVGADGELATPVEELEETLQVEVQALMQKRVMDLAPAWGEAGSYHAVFYPTAHREFRYRVFGTIKDIPFDVTFACSGAGHDMHGTTVDSNPRKITDQVELLEKRGSFGCPKPKPAFGFPNAILSQSTLRTIATLGLILGAIGAVTGIWSVLQIRKYRKS